MRSPKDFFKPKAIGAPEPLREIPFRPSRMIHFFDASNPKMAAAAAPSRTRRQPQKTAPTTTTTKPTPTPTTMTTKFCRRGCRWRTSAWSFWR